ncbi:hypothetical protein O6H91_16G020600 [Diphasiastrum complanatum]|uniref:Uncharacterized protein n=1 Tax=Diphasiastrum complanatum TaxID=34168 RepID=A0ACC2BAD8_DIPCM|nr:hypothetical protein O6H91_16G020600 [Diphasiastrum complanatum]
MRTIPDWIRVRRQPKTLSRNIESASGEAQALDILGKPPCHRNEDNAITSQTLRVSTIQRRFPHIQPNYSKEDLFPSHEIQTRYGDHIESFPCNGISSIKSFEGRSQKVPDKQTSDMHMEEHPKRDSATESAEDVEAYDENEKKAVDLFLDNNASSAELRKRAVSRKVSCPMQCSSGTAWPLGYHLQPSLPRSYADPERGAGPLAGINSRLKKNVTCFVKTLFRWRSSPVSEDEELSASRFTRFQKLFSSFQQKYMASRKSQSEASNKALQPGGGTRFLKARDTAADDSSVNNPRNTSPRLQHNRDHQINQLSDVKTFTIPRTKCEYWINTDSDYVVLVVCSTTSL